MELLGGRSYLTYYPWLRAQLLEQVLAVDLLELTGEVEIKDLREALSQWVARPFGKLRLLYISQAEQLSSLCQTTLLKALEEPPPQGAIILQCDRPDSLLSTVRSRLHQLKSARSVDKLKTENSVSVLMAKQSQATNHLRAMKDRVAVKQFLLGLIAELKETILQSPSPELARKIAVADSAARRLAHNANWKLSIDKFLQDWFESGKERIQ